MTTSTLLSGATQQVLGVVDALRGPLTYDEYAAICETDGEAKPSEAEYETFLSSLIEGAVRPVYGFEIVSYGRKRG